MIMMIVVKRGLVVSLEDLPPKSIALDGFVLGPAVNAVEQKYSFDHHGDCVRGATRSTCEQVLDALLLGLDPRGYTIHVNDVDGDTALAVWLLKNKDRALNDPIVRELVSVVGKIDCHGPAYPLMRHEKRVADRFFTGALKTLEDLQRKRKYESADLNQVLVDSLEGISEMIANPFVYSPERRESEFEVTHTGADGWVMASAEGHAFSEVYESGITKAIIYRHLSDGSTAYTVGKKSEFVQFPISEILRELARKEPGWGGGSTIGGAPRNEDGSRSSLTPDQVFEIVDRVAQQAIQKK